jgi:hypothetical protein
MVWLGLTGLTKVDGRELDGHGRNSRLCVFQLALAVSYLCAGLKLEGNAAISGQISRNPMSQKQDMGHPM